MKAVYISIFCCILVFATSLSTAKAQVFVIPEAGMNLSSFSFNKDGYSETANVGFQAGVLGRFGKNAFFQTGVFYSEFSNQIVFTDSLSSSSDQLTINSILLPINVGFSIVNLDIFKVRLMAGINITFPINVDPNVFEISKSDFNTSTIGAAVGFGLDIYRFVFDANFSFGMNDMLSFNETNATLNLYTINIGYLIGKYY
jgi:hypothetical protein